MNQYIECSTTYEGPHLKCSPPTPSQHFQCCWHRNPYEMRDHMHARACVSRVSSIMHTVFPLPPFGGAMAEIPFFAALPVNEDPPPTPSSATSAGSDFAVRCDKQAKHRAKTIVARLKLSSGLNDTKRQVGGQTGRQAQTENSMRN